MAIVLKDRVKQTAAAPGTGTLTLGSTPAGFQAFSAIGNGNVTYFAIVDNTSGAWEVNYGTYTSSGTTLTRNATPLSSSSAGALVNFTNAVDVFCTYPSEKAIYEETTGNVLIDGGPITVVGTGVTSYTTFGAALAELYANVNSFAQIYAQNLNGGSSASTDIVAYNNLGDGTYNFIDMGIASSNYTEAAYPIFTPGSGYVYNDGGELIIGTGTAAKDVLLFAGGVATTNWAARISGTDQSITTKAGLTVGGAFTSTGAATFSSTVLLNANPTLNLQAATKQYVDTVAATGFTVHPSVVYATAAALPTNTYNNGASGVGATLTATVNGALTVDGSAVTTSQRILVQNEVASANNGCYTVTSTGTAGTPYILTRATDFDTAGAGEIANNAYFFVTAGSTNAGSAFILSQTAAITVGTTALPFTLFSDQLNYVGGTNIDVTGLTISLTGTVAATNGGTGTNTVTTGDLLYGSGTNTWGKLAKGAAYKSLIMDASATNVEWNAVALNQSGAVSGALGATNGGTAQSSYATGDILYASAANTLAKLAGNITTTKKYLIQTGTGAASAAPTWGTVDGADVTGNISGSAGSVANALTLGTYLTGTSFNGSAAVTATVDATAVNTASKVVARDVSGNFAAGTITAALSGNATTATAATNISGGANLQIPYQTGAGATSFITAASGTNYVLNYTGSAFSWVAGTISGVALGSNLNALTLGTYLTGTSYNGSATVTAAVDATSANTASKVVARDASGNFSAGTITATLTGTASTATNLGSGVAGAVPYQSAAGTTGFSAAGTSGQLLTSSGTTAPTWTTAASANTASAIVQRDASGNFSAGTITAALTGNASTATTAAGLSATLVTTSGGTGLTSFTSGGVVYASSTSALATGSGLIFSGTNLGLGLTPSAWNSSFKAFEMQSLSLMSDNAATTAFINQNAYYASGGWTYKNTGTATKLEQGTGQFRWYNAPSGTAGTAASFTQVMTLDASGNLGVGASSPTAKFDLAGDYKEGVITANTTTAYTVSLTTGTFQILTLTGNCTFTFPTATSGKSFMMLLKQDATGGRSVTWPASVKWPASTAPTITSTASKGDKFVFSADGTYWWGSNAGQNYL